MTIDYEKLPAPPALPARTLRVVSLGGLGDVGRNMNVLEVDGKLLIVDCGVLFPEEMHPGVDLILPDFSYLEDRLADIVAVVITHGHEDHIGAVPFLLRLRPDIPIFGSEFTLALIEPKLREHRIENADLNKVKAGETTRLGPFSCQYAAVSHSIPQALSVLVRTEAANVLITGDFKLDQTPLDGQVTDLRAWAAFGQEGVDLLMIDSTNSEVPGYTGSEKDIAPALRQAFAQSTGQIVVAAFASHVHRVQQIIDTAVSYGRHVALVGRSMERNMAIAANLGILTAPEDTLLEVKYMKDLPLNRRVYMVTGSQGEPLAALSRAASNTHPALSLGQGDTVILASSLIPGNETSVSRMINNLLAMGVRVVHQGNELVHVSGHAYSGELLYCYNIVKPRNVMPIHGELRHLVANGSLAVKTGIPPEKITLAQDGVVIDVAGGKAEIVGAIPCDYVYVDGSSVGELSADELNERRVLASEGFVAVFAVVDLAQGMVTAGPHISTRGMAEADSVFAEVLPEVEQALAEAAAPGNVEAQALQQVMRRVLGRWIARKLRRRPMIVPLVFDTGNNAKKAR